MAVCAHSPTRVRLPEGCRRALRAAWRRGLAEGREPCGYLLGRVDAPGQVAVSEVRVGENMHPRPFEAFHLAPAESLAVRHEAQVRELALVGIWHGHLVGPPRPGRADLEGHRDARLLHVIIARRAIAAYEIDRGEARLLAIE